MSGNIDIGQLLLSSIQSFSSFSIFRPCFYFSNSLYTFSALVIDSLLFPILFSSNSLLTFLAFIVNSSLHLIPISENSLFTSSMCIINSPLLLISALCFHPPQLSTLFDDFSLFLLLLFSPWAFDVNSTFTLHELASCRSFKRILLKIKTNSSTNLQSPTIAFTTKSKPFKDPLATKLMQDVVIIPHQIHYSLDGQVNK